MAGIDIDALDHAGPAEADDAIVMAFAALAPAFPPIHPLAVFVVFARNEDRGLGAQHPLLGREELVGRVDRRTPQPRLGEIDPQAGEIRQIGGLTHREGLRLLVMASARAG